MQMFQHSRLLLIPFIALSLGMPVAVSAVETSVNDSQILLSPTSICSKGSASEGKPVVQSMLEKVKQMKGYCFESSLTTYSGTKTTVESGRLYFKSPNMLRFEVTGGSGFRNGAVLVRQADGKIKGEMGGLLHGVKVNLSTDSKLLQTANGFNILESDLSSLLSNVLSSLKSNTSCLVSAPTNNIPEVVETFENGGTVDDRIIVDAQQKLPTVWNIFRGNKIFSVAKFINLQAKNDLTDAFFTLSTSESGSKSLGGEDFNPYTDLLTLAQAQEKTLSVGALNEIKVALASMRQNLSEVKRLKLGKTDAPGPSTEGQWSAGSRELLLKASTELESTIALLRPVAAAIRGTGDKKALVSSLRDSWIADLKQCSKCTAALIDEIDNEHPNPIAINKASLDLSTAISSLQTAYEKLMALF